MAAAGALPGAAVGAGTRLCPAHISWIFISKNPADICAALLIPQSTKRARMLPAPASPEHPPGLHQDLPSSRHPEVVGGREGLKGRFVPCLFFGVMAPVRRWQLG